MAQHNKLGKEGERQAKIYLQKRGYTILHENWRYNHKEIDLVAKKDDFLVVVEVKTRTEGGMQSAEESITVNKIRFLIEATESYIDKHNRTEEVRFDLIAITFSHGNWQISHIKEVFNALDF